MVLVLILLLVLCPPGMLDDTGSGGKLIDGVLWTAGGGFDAILFELKVLDWRESGLPILALFLFCSALPPDWKNEVVEAFWLAGRPKLTLAFRNGFTGSLLLKPVLIPPLLRRK